MIPTTWQFGPFASGLGQTERTARLRAMRTIVQLHLGDRGRIAARALHLAEADPESAGLAVGALERLPSLDRRRVLSAYQRVSREP